MNLRVLKLLIMLFLVIFLTAFSTFKNGERKIDLTTINYLDSNFNFISVESVNKLLKQSDSISLNLLKRDLNLKEIERIINENTFIDSAEVSLSLDGEIGVKIIEKEPVFRVLNDKYYIDPSGNKMSLSKIFSKGVPLIISDVDSTYLKDLGLFGKYIKNDSFLSPDCFPFDIAKSSKYIFLETPLHGGHVGFHLSNDTYYSEKRTVVFLKNIK